MKLIKIKEKILGFILLMLVQAVMLQARVIQDNGQEIKVVEEVGVQKNGIRYRLATNNDVDAISDMFNHMSKEDKEKLIVMPSGYREKYFAKEIHNQHLFVAEDMSRNRVIGFVKIFLVKPQRAYNILEQELHCIGDQRILENFKMLNISSSAVSVKNLQVSLEIDTITEKYKMQDFDKLLRDAALGNISVEDFNVHDRQLFIYLGSSFIDEAYRGKKLGLQLDEYAFDWILNQCALSSFWDYTEIVLMCGQVKGNINWLPFWSYLLFLLKLKTSLGIYERDTQVQCWQYHTHKPTFHDTLDGDGNLRHKEGVPGYGFAFSYKLQ